MNQEQDTKSRLIKMPEVVERSGFSQNTIRTMMGKGKFPPGLRLSPRAVRWREADIDEWLADPEGWANKAGEAQGGGGTQIPTERHP